MSLVQGLCRHILRLMLGGGRRVPRSNTTVCVAIPLLYQTFPLSRTGILRQLCLPLSLASEDMLSLFSLLSLSPFFLYFEVKLAIIALRSIPRTFHSLISSYNVSYHLYRRLTNGVNRPLSHSYPSRVRAFGL